MGSVQQKAEGMQPKTLGSGVGVSPEQSRFAKCLLRIVVILSNVLRSQCPKKDNSHYHKTAKEKNAVAENRTQNDTATTWHDTFSPQPPDQFVNW